MNTPLLRDFKELHPHVYVGKNDAMERLIAWMCPHGVVIGGIYKHFKGKKYLVTGLVRPADKWTELHVEYVELENAQHKATRELSDFLADVALVHHTEPRFKLVGYGFQD